MTIRPEETEIRGMWLTRNNRVERDANCERIDQLVRRELKEVARDATGWDVLYIDPRDGRYWELIYPESHLHGGGPPALLLVSHDDARKKYGVA
jgi:hypothetical protein